MIKLENGYVKIITAETPFNSDKDIQKEAQLKLRKLLYKEEFNIQKQPSWWPFMKK